MEDGFRPSPDAAGDGRRKFSDDSLDDVFKELKLASDDLSSSDDEPGKILYPVAP
jgi:hypothetical protein